MDTMGDNGTNSNLKIFANIFISFIGAGILGLPFAFKEVLQCMVMIAVDTMTILIGRNN